MHLLSNFLHNLDGRLQSLLFTAPVILLAVICHECAHGWVSYKLGDPTAKQAGRLTLNPFKHLDLMGSLCMLFFHVGWAKPVPINPYYYRDRRKGIILVSIAGPAANFIVAFLSMFAAGLLTRFGSPQSLVIWVLFQLCYYAAIVNIGLGLFNLIPIPPLDGSKVVGCLSMKAAGFYAKFQRYWRIVLILCVVTGVLSKPLGMLNQLLINGMWRVITLFL